MNRIWSLCVHCIGLYLFTSGFFLTRFEVTNHSSCEDHPFQFNELHLRKRNHAKDPSDLRNMSWLRNRTHHNTMSADCWMKARFKRVIFVIIDALRYDFVVPPVNALEKTYNLYHNRLPILLETLQKHPKHTRIHKFVADAPTMTMQRLKGLTTGSLPTFLDIKDNLHSSKIYEDNLLDQVIEASCRDRKRQIIFMGDNTWEGLYNTQFTRKYAFDSFNVKDLDTVDRGVVSNLFPELARYREWDLLIAHFLGVDHVGHTFGPNTTYMSDKLEEMNSVLTKLIEELPDRDTLLVVMGDHGMSAEGNHGGATDDETGAALFLYSKSPFLSDLMEDHLALNGCRDDCGDLKNVIKQMWTQENVPQVDIVPSLALLMGIAVPFGNLGSIIPSMFYFSQDDDKGDPTSAKLSKLETVNMAFLLNVRQVRRYLFTYKATSTLPLAVFEQLESLYFQIVDVEEQLAQHWGRAHDTTSAESAIKLHLRLFNRAEAYLHETLRSGRAMWTQFNLVEMTWGIILLLWNLLMLLVSLRSFSPGDSRFPLLGCILGACIPVVLKLDAIPFIPAHKTGQITSLCGLLGMCQSSWIWRSSRSNPREGLGQLNQFVVATLATILMHGMALLTNSYIIAEHQVMQFLVVTLGASLAIQSILKKIGSNAVYASVAVMFLARVATGISSPNVIQSQLSSWRSLLPMFIHAGTVMMLFWNAGFNYQTRGRSRLYFKIIPAMCCFQLIFVFLYWNHSPISSAFCRQWLPRFVFLIPIFHFLVTINRDDSSYIAWRYREQIIYIPATTTSSTALLVPAYMLILGPLSPLSVMLVLGQTSCFAYIIHCIDPFPGSKSKSSNVIACALCWCTMSYHSFFFTGHENSFSSLQNAAGFIGFDEFDFYWAGVLLAFNTFGNYMLQALLMAIVLRIRLGSSTTLMEKATIHTGLDIKSASATAIMYFSLNACVTTVFVAMQRRHLMVWSIFSPKFVFDAITSIVWYLLAISLCSWHRNNAR
uniref:GPI ethanolamine phosphate transferase putative n=1 Tax=Albugo laibachii Nc14 TaxID=890382 RepID=F0WG63_9STRA|nr:GPI ethanolamine phosphate transferase putative [Albugo laibachii Nc14]|eukprot:CCA20198.1 GPI ethanolamine phosphate transferase putative [Albugo laibachii Nc14]